MRDQPDLTKTTLHMAGLLGSVEEHEDHVVVRTPHNPGFYHGNFLLLDRPPEDLDHWMARFEEAFGPEVEHRCFEWAGEPLSGAPAARAAELGLSRDCGVALALDAPPAPPSDPDMDWSVRPLRFPAEWDRFVGMNIVCDPAESGTSLSYVVFKDRLRNSFGRWLEEGHATWWGAFDADEMVGQCGFVVCGDLGRYQGVETHPERRRRGVAGALIAAVARDAFERLGCRRVMLEADDTGPAVELYRRLGFAGDALFQSLVRASEPRETRAEPLGSRADVRSLLKAAFGRDAEADLVEVLREIEGAISMIVLQSGMVLGHVLFTPVTVRGDEGDWNAVALGPMAVRPDQQRRGAGTRLAEAGLMACRAAGHEVCFVLGHPGYYPRFGFEPAPPKGLTCKWPVPDDVFMVLELVPGALAGRTGRVEYHPAFDAV